MPESSLSVPPVIQRDIAFEFADVDWQHWHPGGPHVSHFFNGMSAFFPEGERFFIESVRHYRDRLSNPSLLEDVRGFIGQEAMHGREHRAYNAALAAAGYDTPRLEARAVRLLDRARRWLTRPHQLAITICLEHYTAIMAEALLSDPRVLEGADPRLTALWRWHAIEETEHKAVAFDVFRTVMPGVRGYLLRCVVMLVVTVRFWLQTLLNHLHFLRRDGLLGDGRGWWRLLKFQLVSPGPLRRIVLPWLAWFRPGFHPWQQDNRAHVEHWKQAYTRAGSPPA